MEGQALWHVYPDADFGRLSRLVRNVAVELQITISPIGGQRVPLPTDEKRVVAALNEIQPGWRSMRLLAPPSESARFDDTESVARRRYEFAMFMRTVADEVADKTWSPTSAQIADLHAHLGVAF